MARPVREALAVVLLAGAAAAQAGPPLAVVDLASAAGAQTAAAEWRYRDAEVVAVDFRTAGPDRKPSGPANRTFDIEPKAGTPGFDDRDWPVIAASSLTARRGSGRLCFGWYRLRLTVPERIGTVSTAGRAVTFAVVLDDYAEVWVDGRLPRRLGQVGGSLVAGWNAENRVVLTHRAVPGQQFEIAVFGSNGPLSAPPANYLWIRRAELAVHDTPAWGETMAMQFERYDARLDGAVGKGLTVEVVSAGHRWIEGPCWDRQQQCVLFSDIPDNEVLRWQPGAGTTVALAPSGYTGKAPFAGREPGSNGLAVDGDGGLWLCQHGDRRLARRAADGTFATVVEGYGGRRLNSPNDLLLAPNGDVWFTDPPFGLPRQFDDPARELPFAGVYRRTPDGTLALVESDLRGPNGLALSPDGRTLFVSDADPAAPRWWRLGLDARGQVESRAVLLDAAQWREVRPGYPDGMKIDSAGNLFACGPGGLYVFAPDGTLLGWLPTGVATSNCAFGDDERTLFVTADQRLLALRW